MSNFPKEFLTETAAILDRIDAEEIESMAQLISILQFYKSGRIFFAGSGGGAAHASHATADFRKFTGLECYCISDNVAELTARVNDDSWGNCYVEYLKASKFSTNDHLFVISVGGGNEEKGISTNLVIVDISPRRPLCIQLTAAAVTRLNPYMVRTLSK